MRKLVIRIAAALVALAILGVAAWYYFAPSSAVTEPTTVAVTRGNIEQTVLASGALEAKSVTSVGAEVSGRIQTLAVALGDTINKGDLIAEIDSVDQQNAVKSAQASLANMQAQRSAKVADLTQAQQALARAEKLKPSKAHFRRRPADRPDQPRRRRSRRSRRSTPRSASPSSALNPPNSTSSAPRSPPRSVARWSRCS